MACVLNSLSTNQNWLVKINWTKWKACWQNTLRVGVADRHQNGQTLQNGLQTLPLPCSSVGVSVGKTEVRCEDLQKNTGVMGEGGACVMETGGYFWWEAVEQIPALEQFCLLRATTMASSQSKEEQQESRLCCPRQGTSLQLLQMHHLHSLLRYIGAQSSSTNPACWKVPDFRSLLT